MSRLVVHYVKDIFGASQLDLVRKLDKGAAIYVPCGLFVSICGLRSQLKVASQ